MTSKGGVYKSTLYASLTDKTELERLERELAEIQAKNLVMHVMSIAMSGVFILVAVFFVLATILADEVDWWKLIMQLIFLIGQIVCGVFNYKGFVRWAYRFIWELKNGK